MPTLSRGQCISPSCPNEKTKNSPRCSYHKSKKKRRENQKYDRKASEFYRTSRWQKIRKRYLSHNPVCENEGCSREAKDVDHIEPIANGGEKTTWRNLQALCKECHSSKTAREVWHNDYE